MSNDISPVDAVNAITPDWMRSIYCIIIGTNSMDNRFRNSANRRMPCLGLSMITTEGAL